MDKIAFLVNVKKAAPNADLCKIVKAYDIAKDAHEGHYRKTGEPFFEHPVRVTLLLLKHSKRTDAICASLLHDTVEDTGTTLQDIREEFGDKVAFIVDGVTKGKNQSKKSALQKVMRFGKKDKSIILLKLVDKIDNLETLHVHHQEKQKELLREVKQVYIKMAKQMRKPDIVKEFQKYVQS